MSKTRVERRDNLQLANGSRVAVLGGGPAGSFFSYFLLDMAQRYGVDIAVDVYEARDFTQPAPRGCNMCGGIVSESFVQALATEGIELPENVIQRGIDSYVLHTDVGSVRIETPLQEKRIAAVYRGSGPRDLEKRTRRSFDDFLQSLTLERGAQLISGRVTRVEATEDGVQVGVGRDEVRGYDLLAVATGVNSGAHKLFADLGLPYQPPSTVKTCIREYKFGEETVAELVGSSMHVFLLDLPRVEFAAIVPKGDYITVCLLGDDLDNSVFETFLDSPEVQRCFPKGWKRGKGSCFCSPRINVRGAVQPFADRVVFVGDCAVTRLYKDGIGAAYRTAKTAARVAVFEGISEDDFRRHYWPECQAVARDNAFGKATFALTHHTKKRRFVRHAVVQMSAAEQMKAGSRRRMSTVLWDMFTGSASYRSIFFRQLHPIFVMRFLWYISRALVSRSESAWEIAGTSGGGLGRVYHDGEIVMRQGERGHEMYVIQEGEADILVERNGEEVHLRTATAGEIIGEMALFEPVVRSATVRARGDVRMLTVDKKVLFQRLNQDPTLAFQIVKTLSQRVRELSGELARLRDEQRAHEPAPGPRK